MPSFWPIINGPVGVLVLTSKDPFGEGIFSDMSALFAQCLSIAHSTGVRRRPERYPLALPVQPLEGLLVVVSQRMGSAKCTALQSTPLLVGGGGCARACTGSELGEHSTH